MEEKSTIHQAFLLPKYDVLVKYSLEYFTKTPREKEAALDFQKWVLDLVLTQQTVAQHSL